MHVGGGKGAALAARWDTLGAAAASARPCSVWDTAPSQLPTAPGRKHIWDCSMARPPSSPAAHPVSAWPLLRGLWTRVHGYSSPGVGNPNSTPPWRNSVIGQAECAATSEWAQI